MTKSDTETTDTLNIALAAVCTGGFIVVTYRLVVSEWDDTTVWV